MTTNMRRFTRPAFALMAALTIAAPATAHAWPPITTEAKRSTDGDERIIVGPISPHAFQRQAPDDPGVVVHPAVVNIAAVLAGLPQHATLWYQHVMALSDPFFEGRAPGTEGNKYAADYIEFYFRKYALEPAFPEVQESEDESEDGSGEAEEEADLDGEWTTYRQPFDPGRRESLATDNVGGVLHGSGDLADSWIVIGAHYDHIGYGGRRGRDVVADLVNPGADDNASGTAGMLILAKRFAEQYANAAEDADLRSILFMGFSAEEMGLLGSRHYVRHPTLGAEQIHLMINLDMIGRLRGDTMLVQGVHSAEGLLDRIRPRLLESGLTIYADPTGRGPSDHASFYGAGIPVLFMFTGTHDVYHRPGDVGPTVNPQGAAKVLDLTFNIAWDMATMREALKYTRAEPLRPSLPFIARPDREADRKLRIVEFYEDVDAAQLGLAEGDYILRWNGDEIGGWRDLREKLAGAEIGDVVTLTIERDGEEMDIEVTLAGRDDW